MSKGFIFDVDGTILDSMSIWMDAGKLYLESLGIKTDENIGEVMFEMTMEQGAKYLQDNYNVELSIEEICQGINDRVFEFYEKEAPEKPGIREVLEKAKKRKISMTIATSTDRPMIEAALKRLDLIDYFQAMLAMNTSPENTWLFDDAAYSLATAKKMGINTVGVYDVHSGGKQDEVKKFSDVYIKEWREYKININ